MARPTFDPPQNASHSRFTEKDRYKGILTISLPAFFGLLILPFAVYMVGNSVFGAYGGTGFSAFYGTLNSAIWDGELAILFMVFSPYAIWQLTRLTIWGFRLTRRQRVRT